MTDASASPVRAAPGNIPPAWFALAAALLVSLAMLALSWNLPLLEHQAFRQTQTAISSYWLAGSDDWLAYQTPIVGHPWSIPLEFPLFQVLALGAAKLLPVSLDQGGRLVSWLFAMLTTIPLWLGVRKSTGKPALAHVFVLLFLLSPLYLFGARLFMIESTAVFFGVLFLATLVRYWQRPSGALFVLMLVAATLGALVKITTFFGFGVVGFLFVGSRLLAGKRLPELSDIRTRYLPVAIAVGVALLATMAYLHFSDLHKMQTLWGGDITSDKVGAWTYGTWQQKTSAQLWQGVVFGRASSQLLGSVLVLPVALLVLAFAGRGLRGFAACMAAGYLLPFAVFANLHVVHDYYQQGNGIFLLGLVACAVEALRSRFSTIVATGATCVLVLVMLLGFRRDFFDMVWSPHISQRTVALATFARRATAPTDVLLIFGYEASSEVPYYATRRAMMIQEHVAAATLRRMREQPTSYTGDYRLGLVIVCPNEIAQRPEVVAAEYAQLLAQVRAGREEFRVGNCHVHK